MNPNERDAENYILGENAIIIQSILKEAPVQYSGKVKVAKLEKILDDLYLYIIMLSSYKGNVMKNIL